MKKYNPRIVDSILERKLTVMGGVVLRGVRGCGKTTTGKQFAASTVRLDKNPGLIEAAAITPETILNGDTPRLIDEWQLAPSIWNSVRTEIDERGLPGQFILAGSAAPSEEKTRHTGAGRFSRITLRPMTLFEQGYSTKQVDFGDLFDKNCVASGQGGLSVNEYAEAIVRGGWPSLAQADSNAAHDALQDYIDNIADVDLRTLSSPPDPVRMAALIRALSRNISTEASLELLAKEAGLDYEGISRPSIRKYLNQLTQIFVLEELPAWGIHLRSSIRMRVKPKWHFVDPSLATAALYATAPSLLDDLNTMGLLFESMAIRDIRVFAEAHNAKVFHYRDSTNLEIGAIVERRDGIWLAIEVKLGGEKAIDEAIANFAKLKGRLTKGKLDNLAVCVIVTAGEYSYIRPDGVVVIALGHLFV